VCLAVTISFDLRNPVFAPRKGVASSACDEQMISAGDTSDAADMPLGLRGGARSLSYARPLSTHWQDF
jgi:hypothetical protein